MMNKVWSLYMSYLGMYLCQLYMYVCRLQFYTYFQQGSILSMWYLELSSLVEELVVNLEKTLLEEDCWVSLDVSNGLVCGESSYFANLQKYIATYQTV